MPTISPMLRLVSFVFWLTLWPLAALPDTANSSATLPLDQVLDLYRENDAMRQPRPAKPPVVAVLHQISLTARLLDSAVFNQARFQVVVLAEDEWVSVALMAVDEKTQLHSLPAIEGSALTVIDGYLTLITRSSGAFEFEVEFSQHALTEGLSREARIVYPTATVAVGELSYDTDLFSVEANPSDNTLHPVDGAFTFRWRRMQEVAALASTPEVAPAIESVIPSAHASVVSTLEGTHIIRVLYRLRFSGRKPLAIEIPPRQHLERGYLNGSSITVDSTTRKLEIEVSPTQAGGEGGTLELVLVSTGNEFLLSGELSIPLPVASWRINELFLTTHLPAVFDYTWKGGSLAPANTLPKVNYTYDIPTPGKRAGFHQFLVHASRPSLTLGYNVSLEGNYYRVSD